MFLILKLMYRSFKTFDDEYRDLRSEKYPMMGSIFHMLFLVTSYYIFVRHLGPKLMEKRKPFELKNFILVYNFLQVVFNSYVVIQALYSIFWKFRHTTSICTWPERDYSPRGKAELHLCYCYFLLKLFDYTDTIIMVLRKRDRQISFLHVYHHIMISLGTFGGMRYIPGGHSIAFGVVNCMVHMIMYTYYFFSALRPELKNSLWWKKHITQAQILQFIFLVIHFLRPFVQKDCKYPKFPTVIGLSQSLIMLLLFGDFYRQPLIDHYFLLGSPLKIITVTVLYWLFVMKFGPKYMANRKAFDLKNALLFYNALQVIFNAYLVYLATKTVLTNAFYADWSCMRSTYPQRSYEELHGYYLYYLLKVSDYMDTIFMVLRKRNRQITFLHVYHHILMVFGVYYTARFAIGGHTILLGLVNGIVHVVMYSYYFLAALRPGLRNSAGWKKHITQMQLAQFLFLIVHFARALFNPNCDQSKSLMLFALLQAFFMVYLFSDFYYKAYLRKPKSIESEKIE